MYDISVIIPSYNSYKTIDKCIKSIMRQRFSGTYEIIVVDSSNDITYRMLKKNFPQIKIIRLQERTPPGIARNIGIKHAVGRILAFIDADCIADESWLSTIYNEHIKGKYAAVGGAIDNAMPYNLAGWGIFLCEFSQWLPIRRRSTLCHIPTCNIAYRREIFDKYGTFPSGPFPQEDHLFNLNLCKNGEKIEFEPKIRIYHINRSSVRYITRHEIRRGKGAAFIYKLMYPNLSKVLKILPFTILFGVGKLVINIIRFIRWKPHFCIFIPIIWCLYLWAWWCWLLGFMSGIL